MKSNRIVCTILLWLISTCAGAVIINVPFSTSPSLSPYEQRLEKRMSEWEESESLGDRAQENGYHNSALYFYTQAADASVGANRLSGMFKHTYCFSLSLTTKNIQPVSCRPGINALACEFREKAEEAQCAGTKKLCEKLLKEWQSVVEPLTIVSINQITACLPNGRRLSM